MTLQPEIEPGIHDFDETPGLFPEGTELWR
jgi:hypothetical protein